MTTFTQLINAYLHDASYEKFIALKRDDYTKHNSSQEETSLKSELKQLINWTNEEIALLISRETMGIQGFPTVCIKHPSRYNILIEKIYFDLFHTDPDFKPDLLKLIDPESGELRAEYIKK